LDAPDTNADEIIVTPTYTLEDLEKLERQFKLRTFVKQDAEQQAESAGKQGKREGKTYVSEGRRASRPLVHLSDVEKLQQVRSRQERILQACKDARHKQGKLAHESADFLVTLCSVRSPFPHIRRAELKARSYWYRRGQDDYVENWFLKYTPLRRYYEEVTLDTLEEVDVARLGERFNEFTGPDRLLLGKYSTRDARKS
jgi:hypothetical protein